MMPNTRKSDAHHPEKTGFDWLVSRPVAHRGLHDIKVGRIENSMAAFEAAIEANCSIELDVQLTKDNALVVFHDYDLKRLCGREEIVRSLDLADLQKVSYLAGSGTLPSLTEVIDLVAGRVPIIIEIKTDWRSSGAREHAALNTIANCPHQLALMSFDPQIMKNLRQMGATQPLGLVADMFGKKQWPQLSYLQRMRLRHFAEWKRVKPDFLAYRIDELPQGFVSRQRARGLPILSWTVKNPKQLEAAHYFADAAIFEGLGAEDVWQKHRSGTLAEGAL